MPNGAIDRDWIKWVFGVAVTILSGVLYKTVGKIDSMDMRIVALEVKTHGVEVQMGYVMETVKASATKIESILNQVTDIRISLNVKGSTP